MSLASSPDYMHRPEDKALKTLFPFAEGQVNNTFDDYFDCEYYRLSNDDEDNEKYTPPQDDPFILGLTEPAQSLMKPSTARESPQPWRAGLWCLNGKEEAKTVLNGSLKSSECAQNYVLPTRLIGNENCAVRPPSLVTMNTKNDLSHPRTAMFDYRQMTQVPITRERTLSPTPAYANFPIHGEMAHDEKWQKDFRDFHLQMSTEGSLLSQQERQQPIRHNLVLRQANAKTSTRSATVTCPPRSPIRYHYPFNHVTRPNGGYFEASAVEHSTSEPLGGIASSQTEQPGDAAYSMIKSEHCAGPVWTTESLHSSDSSHYSHGSHYSITDRQRHAINLFSHDSMSPPLTNTVALALPDHKVQVAAPVLRAVNHHLLLQQHQGGLGIYCSSEDEIGRALSYGQAQSQHHQQDTISSPSPTHKTSSSFTSYPPLPPLPTQTIPDLSPFQTPHRRLRSVSRTPSPPVSPTQLPDSRSMRQRSPTRTEPNHPRRKSIHKSGPIREVSHHDKERRTRSSSRAPRTPRTPKTPKTPTSAGFANLDFVNFTPKDSYKLMSDVAPSGSSKTRARREQEAKERRKRLSEAALQAVRRAGGDVSALEEAIYV